LPDEFFDPGRLAVKNDAFETMVMVGMDMGRADYEVPEIMLQAGYFPGRITGVMIVG
jgi:hypothetical protein